MTATTTMAAPPLRENLTAVLKRMRTPYLRAIAPDVLATLEWVHRCENLAISGPSGTGKTHFVEALATR